MQPKLHLITYNRRKAVERFILQCQHWHEDAPTCVGFDVTNIMTSALREDHKNGHEALKGPAFGFEVYKALKAGNAHIDISNKWISSIRKQDDSFKSFVSSYLNNAKSSEDFFLGLQEFRDNQRMEKRKIKNEQPFQFDDINNVDVLDFRPVIGYDGVWKNFRKEFISINRTYEYGTFFQD